ncbi:MAG: HAMP domain-containing protein, partial [Alphaproteobacteria bacterium]|nr:HAMP domain-containing protein [Alphaproteobacteria bacterium]
MLISGASMFVAGQFKATSSDRDTITRALRDHMTADIVHDGLRGNVYHVLYAGMSQNADMVSESADEFVEYRDTILEALADEAGLDLPAEARAQLERVRAPLESYLAATEEIIVLVQSQRLEEARGKLSSFLEAFESLEVAMVDVSAQLEAVSENLGAAARSNAQISDIANWGGVALIVLLVGVLLVLSQRYVTRPLGTMTDGLKRLSEGDLDVKAALGQRVAELDELAQVLSVFRAALESRSELAKQAESSAQQNVARVTETTALNKDIADVVISAINGDFAGRVTGNFSDPELTALASSVNSLVETVDRGIAETGEVLAALADTNLTQRVKGNYKGAFAKLKDDTNAVGDKLSEVVGQLRQTSSSLKSATGEILAGANDLAERTTKQAAAIEETSAAMEQLASTVTDNAKRAGSASAKAQGVSHTAEETGEVMKQSNEAMERISSSSQKISNIIGLID